MNISKEKFTELAKEHLIALESYKMDKNGNKPIEIFGIEKLYESINVIQCCTELKGKENLSFRDWKNLNKYTRAMHGYYKQGDKLVKSMDVILMYKDYQDTL